MSENFLRFKRKYHISRILKSLLYGISAGLFSAGLFLLLIKLRVMDISAILSLPVGIAVALLVGGSLYFLLRKSDMRFAQELDKTFGLEERVETMLAYEKEEGIILDLQREDTEAALEKVSTKQYKHKRLWISYIALGLGGVMFLASLIVPDARKNPSVGEVPFRLTEMHRVGMEELIRNLRSSQMEDPYKSEIEGELTKLLSDLESVTTQRKMQERLADSMERISQSTSNSSSMTEIANSLWDTGDRYAKMLASVINTSAWTEPSWGDYAEKYAKFRALYNHEAIEGEETPSDASLCTELQWKIESSVLKIDNALIQSEIPETDKLYVALNDLVYIYETGEDGVVLGLKPLVHKMGEESRSFAEWTAILDRSMNATSEGIYQAISVQKVNTNVGEYTMTKLSTLFLVPHPAFERPDFVGDGSSSGSGAEDEENKENDESGGGGIGAGATYGSDDYVLDPLTGEYVKYGTLLAKYNALMMEKLESGNYTEEQKEGIKKYFELLYSGIKKD